MTGLNILLITITFLGKIYISIILLRFLLQMARADFYNPISQFIVKVTHPLLKPLRKIIPSIGRQDIASLVLAFLVQLIVIIVMVSLQGQNPLSSLVSVLIVSFMALIGTLTYLLFLILMGYVILSWIAPDSRAPAASLIRQISDFILAPLQRIIPTIGIIDITPMIAIMLLLLINSFIGY